MRKIYDFCNKIIVVLAAIAVASEWIAIVGFIFLNFEGYGVNIGILGVLGMGVSMACIFVTGLISQTIENKMEENEEE